MSANTPPQTSYKPMLDQDGNPIVNRFGKVVSAKLTQDELAEIDRLVAGGTPVKQIAEKLHTTRGRVNDYLSRKDTAERIALLALTTSLVEENRKQAEQLTQLVGIVHKLESRVSDLQTMLRIVNENARRQKIGRSNAERQSRSQRQELNRLRNQLWRRTGQKPA